MTLASDALSALPILRVIADKEEIQFSPDGGTTWVELPPDHNIAQIARNPDRYRVKPPERRVVLYQKVDSREYHLAFSDEPITEPIREVLTVRSISPRRLVEAVAVFVARSPS